MTDLANIALSGLNAHKAALSTTSHNIANINTEGYTRQTTTSNAQIATPYGRNLIGSGVETTNVNRMANEFITTQLRLDIQAESSVSAYHEFASRIDSLMGDKSTALTPSLTRFFEAVNATANDPSSISSRQVLLSEAGSLSSRFHSLHDQIHIQNESVNEEIKSLTSKINKSAEKIADLNAAINVSGANSFKQPSNDLLDQRDEEIRNLTKMIGINVVTEENGQVNISLGTGQPLIVGEKSFTLNTIQNESSINRLGLELETKYHNMDITNQVFGGRIGGLLEVRSNLIDPVFNNIGRLALVVSDTINTQHKLGMDLNNNIGKNLFSDINTTEAQLSRIASYKTNTGNMQIAVSIDDTSVLSSDNYKLSYESATSTYTLKNDVTQETITTFPAPGTVPSSIALPDQGITLTLSTISGVAPINHGTHDEYLVIPARLGAAYMGVDVKEPAEVAAAMPVRTMLASSNVGTVKVGDVQVTDTTQPAFATTPQTLSPPYSVVFTSSTAYEIHDLSNPAIVPSAGSLVTTGTFTPNNDNAVFAGASTPMSLGYEVMLNGTPQAGDRVDITYNSGATGDNRNILKIADLQRIKTAENGTVTYQEAFNRSVSEVGTRTRDARIGQEAAQAVLRQSQEHRDSLSGVSLDEEAADLMRFQNAYQASARVIQVSQELFDTILGSIG